MTKPNAPRLIWIVEADHYSVPGRHRYAHATHDGAKAKAAEEVNALTVDALRDYAEDGLDLRVNATRENWEARLDALKRALCARAHRCEVEDLQAEDQCAPNYYDDSDTEGCAVWITALDLEA